MILTSVLEKELLGREGNRVLVTVAGIALGEGDVGVLLAVLEQASWTMWSIVMAWMLRRKRSLHTLNESGKIQVLPILNRTYTLQDFKLKNTLLHHDMTRPCCVMIMPCFSFIAYARRHTATG
jgi:hypothetical protein